MSLTDDHAALIVSVNRWWSNSVYAENPAGMLAWDIADLGAPWDANEVQLREWFELQDNDTLACVVARIARGTRAEKAWFPDVKPVLTESEFGQLETEINSSQYIFHAPAAFSYDASCLGAPPTCSWREIWHWVRHIDRETASRLSKFIYDGGMVQ